jgi:hypothetical protein
MATNTPQMDFKKGDLQTHYFQLPLEAWTPGGTLWFAAKPDPDNDASDSAAVINKSFGDADIVGALDDDNAEYTVGFVTYRLTFEPTDVNVSFDGGDKNKHFLGEFEFVSSVGEPESFPSDDQFIDVIVYADIKRGTA